jgi:hypothetical protein
MPRWVNPDGSNNYDAMVEDAVKLEHFQDIIKLVYEQGVSAGSDQVIKDAKNSTLGEGGSPDQGGGGKKSHNIEGIDELLDKYGGSKIRFK